MLSSRPGRGSLVQKIGDAQRAKVSEVVVIVRKGQGCLRNTDMAARNVRLELDTSIEFIHELFLPCSVLRYGDSGVKQSVRI